MCSISSSIDFLLFDCRLSVLIPIHKSIQAQSSLWKHFHIAPQGKPDLFPILCYIHTISCHHSLNQQPYTVRRDKGNTKEDEDEDEDVKGTYTLLSGTLAVVTLGVRGTTSLPVVHVKCSLYPKIHPFVWL
jgi:hypothetical protein